MNICPGCQEEISDLMMVVNLGNGMIEFTCPKCDSLLFVDFDAEAAKEFLEGGANAWMWPSEEPMTELEAARCMPIPYFFAKRGGHDLIVRLDEVVWVRTHVILKEVGDGELEFAYRLHYQLRHCPGEFMAFLTSDAYIRFLNGLASVAKSHIFVSIP